MLIGSWQRHPVSIVPAWKILAGEVPAETLAGKLVLIGQTNDAARGHGFYAAVSSSGDGRITAEAGGNGDSRCGDPQPAGGDGSRTGDAAGGVGVGAGGELGLVVPAAVAATGVGRGVDDDAHDAADAAVDRVLCQGALLAAVSASADLGGGDPAALAGAAVRAGADRVAGGARTAKADDDAVFELRGSGCGADDLGAEVRGVAERRGARSRRWCSPIFAASPS